MSFEHLAMHEAMHAAVLKMLKGQDVQIVDFVAAGPATGEWCGEDDANVRKTRKVGGAML